MHRTLAVALALSIGARSAVAQDPLARLGAEARAAVAADLDSARARGIPEAPLVNKALEGQSKGAPADRIAAAVHGLLRGLESARDVLGTAAPAAELVAGSAALRAGVDPAQLARLKREHPGQSVLVPLAVMADLVARGVPADTAAAAVLALARAGAREADLVAFRQNVERDIALGAPAGAAASVRVSTTGDNGFGSTTGAPQNGGLGNNSNPPPPHKP